MPDSRAWLAAGRVLHHPYLLHGDQTLGDHLVEDRQQRLDPVARGDDLDQHWQVLGESQNLRRVKDAVRAETGGAAEHGGPGEAFLAQALDDRHGEGAMVPLIALADEDPHQDSISVEGPHQLLPLTRAPQLPVRSLPAQMPRIPAARQPMRVAPMLTEASSQLSLRRYCSVS